MDPPTWIPRQQAVMLNLLSPNKSSNLSLRTMCESFFFFFFSFGTPSPAAAAPAGRSPSPPRLSFFGTSPLWVLRNIPLDQRGRGERAVKTHEPQTFFQFIKIEAGPPLELSNWSQKRRATGGNLREGRDAGREQCLHSVEMFRQAKSTKQTGWGFSLGNFRRKSWETAAVTFGRLMCQMDKQWWALKETEHFCTSTPGQGH